MIKFVKHMKKTHLYFVFIVVHSNNQIVRRFNIREATNSILTFSPLNRLELLAIQL